MKARHVSAAATLLICSTAAWVVGCAPAEPPPFDAARAMRDVETQVAFGPRVPGTEAHRRCADWIVAQLQETTEHVSRQSFFHIPPPRPGRLQARPDTLAMTNIIASFNQEMTERVTLCAHWDTRPWADMDPDSAQHDQPIPGANDGGSGVAVCLEVARMMAVAPPPFGVDIILFDGEDQGRPGQLAEFLIGSRWFVNRAPNYRPRAVLLLDMIGDADLGLPRERYSDSMAPALTDLVWETAERLGLSEFVDTVGAAIIDDHLPFLFRGIPAVDIIDFDYPYWHTMADTPDKVSPESLGKIGRLLEELFYRTPVERFRTSVVTPPANTP